MKENIKKNKTRLIVYGVLFVVLVASSIAGVLLYNSGHGTVGSIRIKLIPIARTFNELDPVIRNGYIKAECDGKKLVVTYKNDDAKINEKFIYEYHLVDGISYISNTYSDANSQIGDFIATNMIEAIYKLNNGKGKVSDRYRITSFGATSIKDGVVYTNKEEIVTVELNLNSNIVENAIALNIETIQESDYIHVEELAEMVNSLNRLRTYKIKKKDTILYVRDGGQYFEIFFSYSDKEIMLRSAGSVIKILKPELFAKISDEKGIVDLNTTTSEFRTIENVTFKEEGIFEKSGQIYEVILLK